MGLAQLQAGRAGTRPAARGAPDDRHRRRPRSAVRSFGARQARRRAHRQRHHARRTRIVADGIPDRVFRCDRRSLERGAMAQQLRSRLLAHGVRACRRRAARLGQPLRIAGARRHGDRLHPDPLRAAVRDQLAVAAQIDRRDRAAVRPRAQRRNRSGVPRGLFLVSCRRRAHAGDAERDRLPRGRGAAVLRSRLSTASFPSSATCTRGSPRSRAAAIGARSRASPTSSRANNRRPDASARRNALRPTRRRSKAGPRISFRSPSSCCAQRRRPAPSAWGSCSCSCSPAC